MDKVLTRRDFCRVAGASLLASSLLAAHPQKVLASVITDCTTFSDIIFDNEVTGTLESCTLWGCEVSGTTVTYVGPWIDWERGVCRTLSGSLRVRYKDVCCHRNGSRGDMIIEVSNVYLGETQGRRHGTVNDSSRLNLFSFGDRFRVLNHGWFCDCSQANNVPIACDISVRLVYADTITPMPGTLLCRFGDFHEPGRQWLNGVFQRDPNFNDVEYCQGFYATSGFTGKYYLSEQTGISVAGNHFYANGTTYATYNPLAQSVVCEVTSEFSMAWRQAWGGSYLDFFAWQQYAPDAGLKEYAVDRG